MSFCGAGEGQPKRLKDCFGLALAEASNSFDRISAGISIYIGGDFGVFRRWQTEFTYAVTRVFVRLVAIVECTLELLRHRGSTLLPADYAHRLYICSWSPDRRVCQEFCVSGVI